MRDEGGIEAFMYDMLEHKITNNLRKAPETEAMWEQRERYAAANPVVEWWAAKVSSGNLGIPGYPEHFQTSEEWKPNYEVEWPPMVLKSDLLEDYISWSSIHKPRRRVMPNVFFKDLKRLGVKSGRKFPKGDNVRVCYIPELEAAARAMQEVGIKFDDEE
jgi:hypothetical protein